MKPVVTLTLITSSSPQTCAAERLRIIEDVPAGLVMGQEQKMARGEIWIDGRVLPAVIR